MKINWKQVASVAIPLIGVGVNLLTTWHEEQQLNDKIAEKIKEALESKE